MLEVDYASALDHLPRRRLVVLLERQHLQLQIFSDLLYQALNRRLLRPSSRSLAVGAIGIEERLTAQLLELYLQQLDFWLLQPERLQSEPRQRPRAGRGAPAEAQNPPKALRPVRCGNRLLLLLRGSEEQCRRLQLSLQRFALGQLELKAPRGGNAQLLPLEEGRGVELLGFQLRKHPRSRHLSILFERPQLLSSLAQRGLLKGKSDGDFRALSWKSVLHLPAPELVNTVAHYFWGLALHYGQADNGHEVLCLVRHYGLMVAACSLAHKNRSSAQQQLERYGPQLTLRDGDGRMLGQWPRLQQLEQLEPKSADFRLPPAKSAEDLLEQLRRWAQSRSRRLLSPPVQRGPAPALLQQSPPPPASASNTPESSPRPCWHLPDGDEEGTRGRPEPVTPQPPLLRLSREEELLAMVDQIPSCGPSWEEELEALVQRASSPGLYRVSASELGQPRPTPAKSGGAAAPRVLLRGIPLRALSTGPTGGGGGDGGVPPTGQAT